MGLGETPFIRAVWASAVGAACLLPALADIPPIVATLTGFASVVDGDGVAFGKVEIRLQGIAAPELRDPFGEESRAHLAQLTEGREIVCHLDGTTAGKSNRPVGVCYVDGEDLGFLQVKAGMALDCPRYSGGRYSEAQKQAVPDLTQHYQLPKYC